MPKHGAGAAAKPQQVLELGADGPGGAEFSQDRVYRYRLWRRWGSGPVAAWVMLNPSTADEVALDPTIRRCIGFSRMWGCTSIEIVNLFALRCTDPGALRKHDAPVGPDNDVAILKSVRGAQVVVAAWGNNGWLLGRSKDVMGLLRCQGVKAKCLGLTKSGEPSHPLYLPQNAALVAYAP